jgi:putative CocE/NonD family hydrolase
MQSSHISRAYYLLLSVVVVLGGSFSAPAQGQATNHARFLRRTYTKQEYKIPMRDGVKLHTVVYAPRDRSQRYPLLMTRTPYSAGPYGPGTFRGKLGPSRLFDQAKYIFVIQDVRGCYLSEGTFVNMRPHRESKKGKTDIDESTDTYDTIAWLLDHVPGHNGRVGLWGISYPGFYSAAGMIDAHPALKAVSPQAPIADWFFDDFHHHGAFFLPHAFNFFARFGHPRPVPTALSAPRFDHGTPDGYQFFLDLGSLKNVDPRYFRDRVPFWNELAQHPNYDSFWQARNLLPHLNQVAPAVLTVGGWFDAEDLYGALNIYRSIEEKNPGIFNALVMGPWRHGGWGRDQGDRLGNIPFGSKTGGFYRRWIELPFFEYYLKDKGQHGLPEAMVFETGSNRWRRFEHWPPPRKTRSLYFHAGNKLLFSKPGNAAGASDSYISDPQKPVPFTEDIDQGMTVNYMVDDQRFASRRPDVLVYQTEPFKEEITLAGPILADLWVSTSGTAADWVVKLIDVFPPDTKAPAGFTPTRPLGGYQMMVRSEVIRGRFRNSDEKPEPFVPGKVTQVKLELQDVLHTFRPGHRLMVHIQSTWFPLVDRNPQKYVPNIFQANPADFIKATQHLHRSKEHPSCLHVGVLNEGGD